MANRYGVAIGNTNLAGGQVVWHGQTLTQAQIDAAFVVYEKRPDIAANCHHAPGNLDGLSILGCMNSWLGWGGGGRYHVDPAELEAVDPGGWPYVGRDHHGLEGYAAILANGGAVTTPTTISNGDLVQGSDNKVYVISGGQKHWIVSQAVFDALGNKAANIKHSSDAAIAAYPTGSDVTSAADPHIGAVGTGTPSWLADHQSLVIGGAVVIGAVLLMGRR